ncbi:MAG TPA: carboxypeptidase regulatory-like domain-containing protein, partial [Gemmatimonadales bacterium]|nr:carboxypeptidase regulatory-like domain-containing protein [Gemmatimonadales bacterium]
MSIEGFGRIARTLRLWARSRLWAALLALVPAALAAQEPVTLSGKVTSAAGTPLSGAQVTIEPLGAAATSRGDGSYTILVPAARVPSGTIAVTARLIGYKANTVQVSFAGGPV